MMVVTPQKQEGTFFLLPRYYWLVSVRGGKTDPDTWACFKAQPPCVPEPAASMPSPIPICLSVPSCLAQFSPGFGKPFLEKRGTKQKPMALLQPAFCLPSRALSRDRGCSWSWKRGKEDCSLNTAFQERCQGPILPLFPWFSSFS